ncbi:hypothetical protein T492DRAFT_963139 [Pavlovales sp. CCMP2436]|nr:hypothetical protein T492DRAFT_963139 [Pavlovales sp. CCMP2436]
MSSGAFLRSLRSSEAAVAHAVRQLSARPERVTAFAAALHRCGGTILPTAIGKSAAAASRLAASLRSVGARAHWVHAAEWAHGDLGAVREEDVIVCISNSGRSAELLALAAELRALPRPPTILAITGDERSPLALLASAQLSWSLPTEHEILRVLPAGSALAQDLVVNALVAQLAELRGSTLADLTACHPGGAIGAAAASAALGGLSEITWVPQGQPLPQRQQVDPFEKVPYESPPPPDMWVPQMQQPGQAPMSSQPPSQQQQQPPPPPQRQQVDPFERGGQSSLPMGGFPWPRGG